MKSNMKSDENEVVTEKPTKVSHRRSRAQRAREAAESTSGGGGGGGEGPLSIG